MNEEEKEAVEELKKQLRLAMNIDDIATMIRNGYAQTLLNLIEKLQKENEKLKKLHMQDNKHLDFIMENSITVQKVKDKIEEIQEEGYWLFTTDRDSDKCVEVLQELLESEE